MNRYLLLLIALALVTGCDEESGSSNCNELSDNETQGEVWNTVSQRIVIDRLNGNTPGSEDRSEVFDRSRDTLTLCARKSLSNLELTENVECHSDNSSFKLVVTDENGLSRVFYSDNRSCGREQDATGFIELEELQAVMEYIE